MHRQAAALVRNNTVPVNVVREDLDLAELSTVLSKGASFRPKWLTEADFIRPLLRHFGQHLSCRGLLYY